MEEAIISPIGYGSAVNGDQSSLQVQASIPLSPTEKPVPASTENAEIIAGNRAPGVCSHVCAIVCEDIIENEGDLILANENLDEESSRFEVLGAVSGKLLEDFDAVGEDFRCSLETELIDDTAETDGRKKEKNPRRRSKAAKKGSDENKNSLYSKCSAGNSTGFGKEAKVVYSRKEVETLRYCNVEGQRKLWQEIYNAFSPIVRTEYDELCSLRHQSKQSGFGWDTNRAPGVLEEVCKETVDGDLKIPMPVECTCDDNYNGEGDQYRCEEYVEDEDSDGSIQRPAFFVEGEPDFDSGPPEDGLEYLRRVRWEAAQIPKVKVAKLDKSKIKKEQSVYMPQIPEIERCPEHVFPLKQWEEEFLSDFSELRLAISRLDGSHNLGAVMVQSTSTPSVQTVGANGHSSLESTWSAGPTLFTVLKMDLVARVSMLKRQIGFFQSKDELSRNECLWLFALCAAIDTPLDADTSAALRGLLRKCSKLRAAKSELDDEAIMLNILVTISGKFFGQAENHLDLY